VRPMRTGHTQERRGTSHSADVWCRGHSSAGHPRSSSGLLVPRATRSAPTPHPLLVGPPRVAMAHPESGTGGSADDSDGSVGAASIASYGVNDYLWERRSQLDGYGPSDLDAMSDDDEAGDASEPMAPLTPVLAAAHRGDAAATAAAIAAAGDDWREEHTWRFRSPMHVAARCGSVETIDVLLASGCRADGGGGDLWDNTPLLLSARAGHLPAVMRLADADPELIDEPNQDGDTPLTKAVRNQRVDVAAFLLSRGASATLSADGAKCALILAGPLTSVMCRTVLEGALRDVGADVAERTCMLVVTADAGSADVVGRLLEVGARHDVALPGYPFMGAMEAAILGRNPSAVIPVLIGGGCTVGALPRRDGSSARAALDVLCFRGRDQDVPALSALLRAGADVDYRNDVDAGYTALDCAARASNVRMVRTLLAHGASVNAAGGNVRRTALHWAAAALTPSVCMVLIAARADPAALDSDGATPLQVALSAKEDVTREVGRSRERAAVRQLAAARRTVACLRNATPGGDC